jgi:ATP-dependent DNA helicase DinG
MSFDGLENGVSLRRAVEDAFGHGGVLTRATNAFAVRDGQREMALAVAHTIERGGALVVEAGTGVGKTFAYLVPALLSGERVMVSTATKALQDQLFSRDLPRLTEALGLPLKTALLKGRSSYLCSYRLEIARQEAGLDRLAEHALAKIERWALSTTAGDLAELPGLDERSPIIPLVTSTRENCLGSNCPKFKACHVNLARRVALGADVVVVNHHLFFADLAVRESGMAELLPTVRVAIFDEAHQLNETGVQFLGKLLGTAQIIDLARDVLAAGLTHARGLVDWQELVRGLEYAARELRLVVGKQQPNAKLPWKGRAPQGLDMAEWEAALEAVELAMRKACEGLATVSEIAPDFVRLHERASVMAERAQLFTQPCARENVRWLDVGTQIRLVESPLDIAQTVREKMLGMKPPASQAVHDAVHAEPAQTHDVADEDYDPWTAPDDPQAFEPVPNRSWIFTSATLGDDVRLSWFTESCGLEDADIVVAQSPFDYARQAAVYVPTPFPKPNEPGHSNAVARLALEGARALGGCTMVLTTTLRALRTIGDELTTALDGSNIGVLVQGTASKRELVARFRGDADQRALDQARGLAIPSGYVLVASASFWEGIDIPGNALQLVIIDKLPFPPPGDPLVEARSARLESQGRSPFNDYFVAEAAIALKQGAGRLIRSESDQGVLVITDNRLVQMGYGRRLMKALPPMTVLTSRDAFVSRLKGLSASGGLLG